MKLNKPLFHFSVKCGKKLHKIRFMTNGKITTTCNEKKLINKIQALRELGNANKFTCYDVLKIIRSFKDAENEEKISQMSYFREAKENENSQMVKNLLTIIDRIIKNKKLNTITRFINLNKLATKLGPEFNKIADTNLLTLSLDDMADMIEGLLKNYYEDIASRVLVTTVGNKRKEMPKGTPDSLEDFYNYDYDIKKYNEACAKKFSVGLKKAELSELRIYISFKNTELTAFTGLLARIFLYYEMHNNQLKLKNLFISRADLLENSPRACYFSWLNPQNKELNFPVSSNVFISPLFILFWLDLFFNKTQTFYTYKAESYVRQLKEEFKITKDRNTENKINKVITLIKNSPNNISLNVINLFDSILKNKYKTKLDLLLDSKYVSQILEDLQNFVESFGLFELDFSSINEDYFKGKTCLSNLKDLTTDRLRLSLKLNRELVYKKNVNGNKLSISGFWFKNRILLFKKLVKILKLFVYLESGLTGYRQVNEKSVFRGIVETFKSMNADLSKLRFLRSVED